MKRPLRTGDNEPPSGLASPWYEWKLENKYGRTYICRAWPIFKLNMLLHGPRGHSYEAVHIQCLVNTVDMEHELLLSRRHRQAKVSHRDGREKSHRGLEQILETTERL